VRTGVMRPKQLLMAAARKPFLCRGGLCRFMPMYHIVAPASMWSAGEDDKGCGNDPPSKPLLLYVFRWLLCVFPCPRCVHSVRPAWALLVA
jgi:hypothetical protein